MEAKRDQGPAFPIVDLHDRDAPGTAPRPTFRLVVDERGGLWIPVPEGAGVPTAGRPCEYGDLPRELTAWWKALRPSEGTTLRSINLVLRADQRAPWACAHWIMHQVAAPDIAIHRFFLAVSSPKGDEEAFLALFLPAAQGMLDSVDVVPDGPVLRLSFRESGPRRRPRDVLHAVSRALERVPPLLRRGSQLEVEDAGLLSVGEYVAFVDSALRAGIAQIAESGHVSAAPADANGQRLALDDILRRLERPGRAVSLALDGSLLPEAPADFKEPPVPDPVRDGLAGSPYVEARVVEEK